MVVIVGALFIKDVIIDAVVFINDIDIDAAVLLWAGGVPDQPRMDGRRCATSWPPLHELRRHAIFLCSRFLDTGRSDLSVPQSRGVLLGLRLGHPQGNQSGTALLEEGTAAGLPRKYKENGRVSRPRTPPSVDRPNPRRSDTKAFI